MIAETHDRASLGGLRNRSVVFFFGFFIIGYGFRKLLSNCSYSEIWRKKLFRSSRCVVIGKRTCARQGVFFESKMSSQSFLSVFTHIVPLFTGLAVVLLELLVATSGRSLIMGDARDWGGFRSGAYLRFYKKKDVEGFVKCRDQALLDIAAMLRSELEEAVSEQEVVGSKDGGKQEMVDTLLMLQESLVLLDVVEGIVRAQNPAERRAILENWERERRDLVL